MNNRFRKPGSGFNENFGTLAEGQLHLQWGQIYAQIQSGLVDGLTKDCGIFSVDALLVEHAAEPRRWLNWLAPEQFKWLKRNESFSRQAEQHHWCRILVLPYIPFLRSPEQRKRVLLSILTYVHLHLWHGVVVGAVFMHAERASGGRINLADVNFVSVPRRELMFYIPAYYRASSPECTVLENDIAIDRLTQVKRDLNLSKQSVIWLYYDGLNFVGKRLPRPRWNALREFFFHLYRYNSVCEYCGEPYSQKDFDLDHIMPLCEEYSQTIINLRPLHSGCNKRKRAEYPPINPFAIPAFVPEDYQTPRLVSAFHSNAEPKWIRSLKEPMNGKRIVSLFGLDEF